MRGSIMRESTACFTGPRPEKLMAVWNEQDPGIQKIKTDLFQTVTTLATKKGYQLFLTGMARGIDLIAAETVISVKKMLTNVDLAAVIPYRNQQTQQSEFWRKRYDAILEECSQVFVLHEEYTPSCFIERNRYMVDHSSHIIAVSNGIPIGGTASTIRYAKKRGLDFTVIATSLTAQR